VSNGAPKSTCVPSLRDDRDTSGGLCLSSGWERSNPEGYGSHQARDAVSTPMPRSLRLAVNVARLIFWESRFGHET